MSIAPEIAVAEYKSKLAGILADHCEDPEEAKRIRMEALEEEHRAQSEFADRISRSADRSMVLAVLGLGSLLYAVWRLTH